MIIIVIFFFFCKNIQKADNKVLPISRKSSLDIWLLVQADRSNVKADSVLCGFPERALHLVT